MRSASSIFGDWATWAIRAIIPAIAIMGYEAYKELQQINITVAVLETEVSAHGKQLDAIWKRLSPPAIPPP